MAVQTARTRVVMDDDDADAGAAGQKDDFEEKMLPARQVLTARSIVFGLIIGTVTTIENIYFALKYGWTVTNNITAAILGFVVIKAVAKVTGGPDLTAQENCVLMTVSVAATAMVWGGSMPFAILAMSKEMQKAVGFGPEDSDTWEPTVLTLVAYSGALCFIGFCLAIPLRKKFVVDDPLPFPYALAAAKTIRSLHQLPDPPPPKADQEESVPVLLAAGQQSSQDGDRPRYAFSQPAFLLKGLLPAMAFGMVTWSIDGLERVPLFGLRAMRKYSWQFNLSVAPLGRGFIVPPRYIFSELLGASLSAGVFLPLAVAHEGHWFDKDASGFEGKDAYYLMPAIVAVAFDSIYQLCRIVALYGAPLVYGYFSQRRLWMTKAKRALNVRRYSSDVNGGTAAALLDGTNSTGDETTTTTFASGGGNMDCDDDSDVLTKEKKDDVEAEEEALSKKQGRWWPYGWLASSIVALGVFRALFNTRYDMAAVALISSPLWSVGITMAVGTTGSNVASSTGKVMIMLFAAWYGDPGHCVQTLALGALAIAVIDQALDLVRDFKTAHLLKASPRAMFVAQSLGAVVSVFTSSALYYYYVKSVSLPSANLPAVIAESYRALAFAFAGGISKLPAHALQLSCACGAAAVTFNLIHDCLLSPAKRKFCPSGVAFGVGLFLLPGQILVECLGLTLKTLWHAVDPVSAAHKDELLGAALLSGDGLAGVLQSALEVGGVTPPYSCSWKGWYQ